MCGTSCNTPTTYYSSIFLFLFYVLLIYIYIYFIKLLHTTITNLCNLMKKRKKLTNFFYEYVV